MKAFYLFFLIVTVSFSQSKLAEAKKLIDNKSFSKAQNLLEAEIKNQPNNAEVIELLGDAYGHQKKWDEAIEKSGECRALSEAAPFEITGLYDLYVERCNEYKLEPPVEPGEEWDGVFVATTK